MRLNSQIWVAAYLRRAASGGAMGVVLRHGDNDAGAVFVRVRRRDGQTALFVPAPIASSFDSDAVADVERRFTPAFKGSFVPEGEIDGFLEKEVGFDPDLWVIEVESADGAHFLDCWLSATP